MHRIARLSRPRPLSAPHGLGRDRGDTALEAGQGALRLRQMHARQGCRDPRPGQGQGWQPTPFPTIPASVTSAAGVRTKAQACARAAGFASTARRPQRPTLTAAQQKKLQQFQACLKKHGVTSAFGAPAASPPSGAPPSGQTPPANGQRPQARRQDPEGNGRLPEVLALPGRRARRRSAELSLTASAEGASSSMPLLDARPRARVGRSRRRVQAPCGDGLAEPGTLPRPMLEEQLARFSSDPRLEETSSVPRCRGVRGTRVASGDVGRILAPLAGRARRGGSRGAGVVGAAAAS